jgi:hypothetical protein
MPYHTAPIPFFTLLLLLGVYRWVERAKYGFPLALFSLSVLYNLELATVTYVFAFAAVLLFGAVKRTVWFTQLRDMRLLGYSFLAGILPMLPVLLYDMQHGFSQTFGFAAWMGYKVLTVFGYPSLHPEIASASYSDVVLFFMDHLRMLLFLPNGVIAVLLFLGGSIFLGFRFYRESKSSQGSKGVFVLGWFFLSGIAGFLAAKTTSEAYLPMLFPTIIVIESYFFATLLRTRSVKIITVVLLLVLISGNLFALLQRNYLMGAPDGYGLTFAERVKAAEAIVTAAGENSYTIKGTGPGSEFPSFTMNYAYLTWWLGHGPSVEGKTTFIISESADRVTVRAKK